MRDTTAVDGPRWRQFIVEQFGFVAVRTMSGERTFFAAETDTEARTISLERRGEQPASYTLRYELPDADTLVLRGDIAEGPAEITLRRRDPKDFELVKRGFHWVNEYPYNR